MVTVKSVWALLESLSLAEVGSWYESPTPGDTCSLLLPPGMRMELKGNTHKTNNPPSNSIKQTNK